MSKKFFSLLLESILAFMISSCAAAPTIIEISSKISLPPKNYTLIGMTVSVNSVDQRQDRTLAKVTRGNKQVPLTASRDLRFLLQEALEKQMASRGYKIGPRGDVDLYVIIRNMYADVSEGNLRYSIISKADISILATRKKENKSMTKNYYTSYSVKGLFHASNKDIANAVNKNLSNIIGEMAQDTSIHNFIRYNVY